MPLQKARLVIGIDTNILIRAITQDDPRQSKLAQKFLDGLTARNPGFISIVTLTEIAWVLSRGYGTDREELIGIIHALLTTAELRVERSDVVYRALRRWTHADFSDALIAELCLQAGCEEVVTFDKKARKVGMTLL